MHDAEIVLEQHEVGRLLGDVRGAVDRDADIGRMQRRSIVDAVAEKAHHHACALQGQENSLLLLRPDAAEQIDRRQPRPERLLGQASELLPGQHAAHRDADLAQM